MYKWIWFMVLCLACSLLQAQQFDEELAVKVLFRSKQALNRAAHAAAQQVDRSRLARGEQWIDEAVAEQTVYTYLRKNLDLDASFQPKPGSFLKSRVRVVDLQIVNANQSFPYTYLPAGGVDSITLNQPGVVVVIRVQYPRTFTVLGPITWTLSGSSELYRP